MALNKPSTLPKECLHNISPESYGGKTGYFAHYDLSTHPNHVDVWGYKLALPIPTLPVNTRYDKYMLKDHMMYWHDKQEHVLIKDKCYGNLTLDPTNPNDALIVNPLPLSEATTTQEILQTIDYNIAAHTRNDTKGTGIVHVVLTVFVMMALFRLCLGAYSVLKDIKPLHKALSMVMHPLKYPWKFTRWAMLGYLCYLEAAMVSSPSIYWTIAKLAVLFVVMWPMVHQWYFEGDYWTDEAPRELIGFSFFKQNT